MENKRYLIIPASLLIIFAIIFALFPINVQVMDSPSQPAGVVLTVGEPIAATGLAPDYVGTTSTKVKEAIDALPASGGTIQLISAAYTFSATVSRAINNVTIRGVNGTTISYDGSHACFSVGSQTGWKFEDLITDAGGITNYNNAQLINVTIGPTYYAFRAADGTNVAATYFTGGGANITTLNASALSTGTVGTARLGTGTANSTTYLRGDGSWNVINASGTGDMSKSVYDIDTNDVVDQAQNSTLLNGQAGSYYLNADNIASGTVPAARLGSGTANNTTYLRGDSTWVVINTTATGTITGTVSANYIPYGNTTDTLANGPTWNVANQTIGVGNITAASLTSNRIPVIGTNGLITDDADLTFAADTLTATKIATSQVSWSALGSDHTWGGVVESGTIGETLAFGDLCYYKSDGKWWLTDADAAATTDGILAICVVGGNAEATGSFLTMGYVRDDTWAWGTVGGALYVDVTAGDMSHTAPSASGDQVRRVGFAKTADITYFCPDTMIIELT